MFTANSDHHANVACQWETLAQQVYIEQIMETLQAISLFFVCCEVTISCSSTVINWRSACIVAKEIHKNVEKVEQSIHK